MNKKIMPILIVGFFLTIGFTSCKKEQNCVCTTTLTDLSSTNPFTPISASATTKLKDTKKNAKANCDKGNSSTTNTDNETRTDVKCEIQ